MKAANMCVAHTRDQQNTGQDDLVSSQTYDSLSPVEDNCFPPFECQENRCNGKITALTYAMIFLAESVVQ